MIDLPFVALALALLLATGWVLNTYWDVRDAARAALWAALERGDLRQDQYAAHLRTLEDQSV